MEIFLKESSGSQNISIYLPMLLNSEIAMMDPENTSDLGSEFVLDCILTSSQDNKAKMNMQNKKIQEKKKKKKESFTIILYKKKCFPR